MIKRIILISLCLFFVIISKGQENKNSYEIAVGIAKVTDKHFDSPNVNVNFTYKRFTSFDLNSIGGQISINF